MKDANNAKDNLLFEVASGVHSSSTLQGIGEDVDGVRKDKKGDVMIRSI
jgi:hypothetical protein